MSSELDSIEQVISMLLIGCAVVNYIRVIQYVCFVVVVFMFWKKAR